MQKYFIGFLVIIFAAAGAIILTDKVFAQETAAAGIQYPVKELGDCKDQVDCKSYCDNPENIKACVDFAEKNNLMSEEEIQLAKNFIAAGSKGPGGCTGKDACEQYCNEINNIDKCISFAEKNNLLPPAELEEAKKVQAAIARGVKPPPCGNKNACDAYCEEPEHMEECITFGAEAGFIQGKELEDAQKMLQAIKKGVKPPPCKGKEACDEYCSTPENMEVCMNFAMEAGFMNEQEKTDSQKMLQAIKKGVKPPNCKGKEECDVYCSQEYHFEECTNFAEAAGFMTAEEAAMARKTGGKGPGGCVGKEECEAFCNNFDNQETCFNFAKDNGMIPEEDLKQMEQGKQQLQQSLQQAPPVVIDCLQSELGQDMVEKIKSGTAMPPKEISEKMQGCFQKMGQPQGSGGPGEGGMIPPAGQTGPGGCKTAEECQNYCESHPQECSNLQSPPVQGDGQGGPGTAGPAGPAGNLGPGGCASPEECQNFQQPPSESGMPAGPGSGGFQQAPPTCTSPEECQQMQNQMMNPVPCEGENCQYGPPPSGQQQPAQQQPPAGENIPMPPQPPVEQQLPAENPPPPPSSLLGPNSLLGSIIQSFLKLFSPQYK